MAKFQKWAVPPRGRDEDGAIREIARELNILPLTARLLYDRGCRTAKEALRFMKIESESFHDPMLLADMDRACDRVIAALDRREKIVIYGDYDVDGVTSVSILYLYLKSKNAQVGYYIPSRIGEGYGLNTAAIAELAGKGYSLMITVDTGVTAVNEIAYAASLGMDTVVTDHHTCPAVLPEAAAVVNPKREDSVYPFPELAGCGVTFKLISAVEYRLIARRGLDPVAANYMRPLCEDYVDLAALGTVADVMPLRDENRLIVSLGLKKLSRSSRPGVRALLEQNAGNGKKGSAKVTSSTVGYTLAPRINAAGRIGHASRAVELFLTSSETEGEAIAAELSEINRERQRQENEIMEEALAMISESGDTGENGMLILDSDKWHHGVIGIVSSRLTEQFHTPSILITFDGDTGKGSGRSIPGMNLVEALASCSDLLLKFGGHELAAGLSIERKNLPEFIRRMNEYARTHLNESDRETVLALDAEVDAGELTLAQAKELYYLEPYGVSNPVPLFCLRDAVITELAPIGGGRHSRVTLRKDGQFLSAVWFGAPSGKVDYCAGDRVDAAFELGVNEFRGEQNAQLIIRDIRHAADYVSAHKEELKRYRAVIGNENDIPRAWDALPTRNDFAAVYVRLRRETAGQEGTFFLHRLLADPALSQLGYVKFRVVLDVLRETGILEAEPVTDGSVTCTEGECFRFRVIPTRDKVNLERSEIFRSLKRRLAE